MAELSRLTSGLALLACIILGGCASPPPAKQPEPPASPAAARPGSHVGQLIVGTLHAMRVADDPARAVLLANRGAEEYPNRPELLWLKIRICMQTRRCAAEPVETQLRKLDPGNAAVWLGPLQRAHASGDEAAVQQILEAFSRSEKFDIYWNALLWQGASARAAASNEPRPQALNGPLTRAINDVGDWLTAVAVPRVSLIAELCSPERAREAMVARRCARASEVLQNSDTYLADAVGIGIAQRLVDPVSEAALALTERAANLKYQHETARAIMAQQLEREKLSEELIELMRKLRREQDVSLAILRWAGQPLTPAG